MSDSQRTITRRRFVVQTIALAAGLPGEVRRPRRIAPPTLHVGVLNYSGTPSDARSMGVMLGAEEATHAAALFGGGFEVVAVRPDDTRLNELSAVIGDGDCERTIALSKRANAIGIPLFNVGCGADDLRSTNCGGTTFHVALSNAMRRDALATAKNDGDVAAWDPSLARFGADTLNRRFLERFKQPMTSDAWTAWFATKVAWESGLRMASSTGAKLIEYLKREGTQFDGHKGLPLSFRSWDNQLRQPVYVIAAGQVIDVPAGTAAGEPARIVLDRIGAGSSAAPCKRPT